MAKSATSDRIKIAEALLIRGDLQKRLAELRGRIQASAIVQQGDASREDPQKLLAEAMGITDDLAKLIAKINRANMTHRLDDGRTLMEAVVERDCLKQRHSLLKHAAESATKEPERYSVREIKWVAQFDTAKLHKQADDIARKIRDLNVVIQEANWKFELEK